MTPEERAEIDAFLRRACPSGAAPGAPADTVERTDRMTETPEFRPGQRLHVAYDAEFVCYTHTGRAVVTIDAAPLEWRYEVPIGATLTPLPDPIKVNEVIPAERLPELGVGSAITDIDAGINVWVRDVDRFWYKTGGAVGAADDYFIPSRAFQVLRVTQP
jgi:hypothetical protein